jgi:hypothetical protein
MDCPPHPNPQPVDIERIAYYFQLAATRPPKTQTQDQNQNPA